LSLGFTQQALAAALVNIHARQPVRRTIETFAAMGRLLRPTPAQAVAVGIHFGLLTLLQWGLGAASSGAAFAAGGLFGMELKLAVALLELFRDVPGTQGNPNLHKLLETFRLKQLTSEAVANTLGKKFFRNHKASGQFTQRLVQFQQTWNESQRPPANNPTIPPARSVEPPLEKTDVAALESLLGLIVPKLKAAINDAPDADVRDQRIIRELRWILRQFDRALARQDRVLGTFAAYFHYGHPLAFAYLIYVAARVEPELHRRALAFVASRERNANLAQSLSERVSPSALPADWPQRMRFVEEMCAWMRALNDNPDEHGTYGWLVRMTQTLPWVQRDDVPLPTLVTMAGILANERSPGVNARAYRVEIAGDPVAVLKKGLELTEWVLRGKLTPEAYFVVLNSVKLPEGLSHLFLQSVEVLHKVPGSVLAMEGLIRLMIWTGYSIRQGSVFPVDSFAQFESVVRELNNRQNEHFPVKTPLTFEGVVTLAHSPYVFDAYVGDLLAMIETLRAYPEPFRLRALLAQLVVQAFHGPPARGLEEFDLQAARLLLRGVLAAFAADPDGPNSVACRMAVGLALMSHYDPADDELNQELKKSHPRLLAAWLEWMAERDRECRDGFQIGKIRNALGGEWQFQGIPRPIFDYVLKADWHLPSRQQELRKLARWTPVRVNELDTLIENDINTDNPNLLDMRYKMLAAQLRKLADEADAEALALHARRVNEGTTVEAHLHRAHVEEPRLGLNRQFSLRGPVHKPQRDPSGMDTEAADPRLRKGDEPMRLDPEGGDTFDSHAPSDAPDLGSPPDPKSYTPWEPPRLDDSQLDAIITEIGMTQAHVEAINTLVFEKSNPKGISTNYRREIKKSRNGEPFTSPKDFVLHMFQTTRLQMNYVIARMKRILRAVSITDLFQSAQRALTKLDPEMDAPTNVIPVDVRGVLLHRMHELKIDRGGLEDATDSQWFDAYIDGLFDNPDDWHYGRQWDPVFRRERPSIDAMLLHIPRDSVWKSVLPTKELWEIIPMMPVYQSLFDATFATIVDHDLPSYSAVASAAAMLAIAAHLRAGFLSEDKIYIRAMTICAPKVAASLVRQMALPMDRKRQLFPRSMIAGLVFPWADNGDSVANYDVPEQQRFKNYLSHLDEIRQSVKRVAGVELDRLLGWVWLFDSRLFDPVWNSALLFANDPIGLEEILELRRVNGALPIEQRASILEVWSGHPRGRLYRDRAEPLHPVILNFLNRVVAHLSRIAQHAAAQNETFLRRAT